MVNIVANWDFWVAMGFLGQFIFFLRFFFQWIYSEKKKKSVIPFCFWYFSIGGGAILFIYAVHIKDPVFSLGQGLGLLIYVRNIILIKKENKKDKNEDNLSV